MEESSTPPAPTRQVVALPGSSRPLIRAEDYRAFLVEHTFNGERVRP
jgi:hypothetical protein